MSTDNPGWVAWRHLYDECLSGYLACLFWTSHCEGEATHPDPDDCRGADCDAGLDDLGYEPDQLAPGAATEIDQDLHGFVTSCLAENPDAFEGIDAGQVGYDFCLTRSGAGTGFWDRGLGERGKWLTKMSKSYGDQCAQVGSDDLVYVHG